MKISTNLIIFAVATLLTFSGCGMFNHIEGSDTIISMDKTSSIKYFTDLEIGTSIKARIIPSTNYSVKISANHNLVKYLKVENENSVLSISLDTLFTSFSNIQIEAIIMMPHLQSISATTNSKVNIENYTNIDDLDINLSTSAVIEGKIGLSGTLDVEATTSSVLNLTGHAYTLKLEGTTSAEIKLFDFPLNNANIDLTTSALAQVYVVRSMDVSLTTSATLEYRGNPEIKSLSYSTGATLNHID